MHKKIVVFCCFLVVFSLSLFAGSTSTEYPFVDETPIIRSVFIEAPGGTMTGYVGCKITLTGVNFKDVTAVMINKIPIPNLDDIVVNETMITFNAIPATGLIEVRTRYNGSAVYGTKYTDLGYITTTEGNWNDDLTWLNKKVPPNTQETSITIAHPVNATSGILNAGTLTINKTGALTIASVLNLFGDCANKGALNSEGVFRMQEKSTFSGNTPVYSNSSTLEYVGYKGSPKDEWNGNGKTAGAGTPYAVVLRNDAALKISNAKLAIGSGITIGDNSSLLLDSAQIALGGNWEKSDAATFTSNSGSVTFKGPGKQKIIGTNAFTNVAVNNSNGVVFSGAISISGTLNFLLGKVFLEKEDLTMLPKAMIQGYTNRKYIVTSASGKLFQETNAEERVFPIGNKSYNPITLNAVSGSYGVRVADSIPSVLNKDKMINRIWAISSISDKANLKDVVAQYNRGEAGKSFNAAKISMGFLNSGWETQKAILTETGTSVAVTAKNLSFGAGEHYLVIGNPAEVKTNPEPAAPTVAKETKPELQAEIKYDFAVKPNPFVTSTKITITSPETTVNVKVFDARGKLVQEEHREGATTYTIVVGADFPSGVYTAVVTTKEKTKSLRIVKR